MLTLSLTGGLILSLTVFIHAIGTSYWITHLLRRYQSSAAPLSPRSMIQALVMTALALVALHIVEVTIWAFGYLYALPPDVTWTFEEAIYFSLVTFTTLGYGDITLGENVRLLSGIEALNGILLVGWSTALLFAVLQRAWQGSGRAPN